MVFQEVRKSHCGNLSHLDLAEWDSAKDDSPLRNMSIVVRCACRILPQPVRVQQCSTHLYTTLFLETSGMNKVQRGKVVTEKTMRCMRRCAPSLTLMHPCATRKNILQSRIEKKKLASLLVHAFLWNQILTLTMSSKIRGTESLKCSSVSCSFRSCGSNEVFQNLGHNHIKFVLKSMLLHSFLWRQNSSPRQCRLNSEGQGH